MSENDASGAPDTHRRARIGMFDMLPLYVMDGNTTSAFSYNFWKVVD